MIDLKPYVKRRVLIQLKAPYQYQLVRSEGGKPVPLAVMQKDGKLVIAPPSETEARPLTAEVIVGVVVERDGRYVVEMDDQTSRQGHKIEAEIAPEFIQVVNVVREDSVITLG